MSQCMFPRPEFNLLPDLNGPRMYANVDNRLEVALDNGETTYIVPLAVPTGLFTLMRGVMKIPIGETVRLSIDELAEGEDVSYVFSLMCGDSLYDLWRYSRGSVPQWILGKEYRL